MNTICLGLGTNLGDRLENLRTALALLAQSVSVEKKSSVYESVPFGVGEQPRYYNMTVAGTTQLAPHDLLIFLKSIERDMGRPHDSHNEPRVIDLDVLMHGENVVELPELTIPHPRMHERAFVLVPLEEIAPFDVHPVLRRPIIDLRDELGDVSEDVWHVLDEI